MTLSPKVVKAVLAYGKALRKLEIFGEGRHQPSLATLLNHALVDLDALLSSPKPKPRGKR